MEKHQQAQSLSDLIGEEGDLFIIIQMYGVYKFKDLKNLSWKEFPYTIEKPAYEIKSNPSLINKTMMEVRNGVLESLEEQLLTKRMEAIKKNDESPKELDKLIEKIDTYKEWIIAVDPDHTGIRGFDLLFEKVLKKEIKDFSCKSVKQLMSNLENKKETESLIEKSVCLKYCKKNTHYEKCQNTYKNKDYVDYNFNINSLFTFDEILKIVGSYHKNTLFTHFKLKALSKFREFEKINIAVYIHSLHNDNIGSPSSRMEILEDLGRLELIENIDGKELKITEKGKEFISLIQPKEDLLDTTKLIYDIDSMDHEDFKRIYKEKLRMFFCYQNDKIKRKQFFN